MRDTGTLRTLEITILDILPNEPANLTWYFAWEAGLRCVPRVLPQRSLVTRWNTETAMKGAQQNSPSPATLVDEA